MRDETQDRFESVGIEARSPEMRGWNPRVVVSLTGQAAQRFPS